MMMYRDFHGRAFLPDPITSSGHSYNDNGFSDNDDLNSDSLAAQTFRVTLRDLTYDTLSGSTDSAWVLTGPYVKYVDLPGGPFVGDISVDTVSDSFVFDRSEKQFEGINAYFHVDYIQRRVEALGIIDIEPGQVLMDAHYDTFDNSGYDPYYNFLAFGEGALTTPRMARWWHTSTAMHCISPRSLVRRAAISTTASAWM